MSSTFAVLTTPGPAQKIRLSVSLSSVTLSKQPLLEIFLKLLSINPTNSLNYTPSGITAFLAQSTLKRSEIDQEKLERTGHHLHDSQCGDHLKELKHLEQEEQHEHNWLLLNKN